MGFTQKNLKLPVTFYPVIIDSVNYSIDLLFL